MFDTINMTKNTWLGRLQTLRLCILILFCLMNMTSNSFLNIYLYTHRLIHLSLLIGEASLGYECSLVQKVTTGHRRKMFNLKLVVYKSFHLRLRGHHWKWSEKILRTRGWGGEPKGGGVSVFSVWPSHCTHEVTEVVVTCSKPTCNWALQYSIMERGGDHEAHPSLRDCWLLFWLREEVSLI